MDTQPIGEHLPGSKALRASGLLGDPVEEELDAVPRRAPLVAPHGARHVDVRPRHALHELLQMIIEG